MRGKNRLIPALLSGALLLTLACAGTAGAGRRRTLYPSSRPFDPRIPLPEGFRLADQPGTEQSNGGGPAVRHRYTGRADSETAHRFYVKQMPLVRWTLVQERQRHGVWTMRFERGAEGCTVKIKEQPSLFGRRVVVDVAVRPLAPGTSRRSQEGRTSNHES